MGLLTLGGCGGGGGGGGGNPDGIAPVAFVYPPSLADATPTDNVGGFMSPYALDPATPSLSSVLPTVSGAGAIGGTITITVDPITLPSSTEVPRFVVTFNPASNAFPPLSPSPLDALGCSGCLRTDVADAFPVGSTTPVGQVTFTFLDPASAGLTYSALGLWTRGGTSDTTWPEIGGAFSAGVLTRGIDLPTVGTATYNGYFIGRYVTSTASLTLPGTYIVGANAHATADFGAAGSVSFWTLNTTIAPEVGGTLQAGGTLGTPIVVPGLDLTSTAMPITRTSTANSFAGTVTTGNMLSGPIQGGFYGPPATTTPFAPPEAGGSLSVGNGTDQSMVGSFALKKQ